MYSLRGRLTTLFLLSVFFIFLFVGVRNQSQSWYFQDEAEHVVLGWMMTDFDRTLYSDLSTNHQPLPVFVGAVLAKAIPYSTFFEFIDRLRISMWLFAFLASTAIVLRFGWRGLLATTATYSLGHPFFAWHVLAEPLAAPAILWILLTLFEKKTSPYDFLLCGAASFWAAFCLLPLWPFLALANFTLLYPTKGKYWKWLFAGALAPTLILFFLINPMEWWQETIINNIRYFIPYETAPDAWHYPRLLLYPIIHVTSLENPVARFYIMTMFCAFIWWWRRGEKKFSLSLATLALLIVSLNPRISTPNASFYTGFHLFPYIAGLSVILSASFFSLVQEKKNPKYLFPLGAFLFCALLLSNSVWVWEKKDKLSDYYIQYDTFQAYGNALKSISKPSDTLMTGPNGAGYLNMMSGIPLAGKQHFHLEWAYRVPYLRKEWLNMMQTEPPTFVYFDLSSDSYSQHLQPILEQDYVVLRRTDGSPTQMRMKKSALESVTTEQWKNFEAQSFQVPQK